MGKTSEPDGVLTICYHISFTEAQNVHLDINLDRETLAYLPNHKQQRPDWTSFDFLACEDCPTRDSEVEHCPLAVNLVDLVEAFSNVHSYERVDVVVKTEQREYRNNNVRFQTVLSSLFGILMVTSGCHDLDMLRPMVYFHLPFATTHETIYRAVSMYLIAQYFRKKHDLNSDWDLDGLHDIYRRINTVNVNTVRRLQKIAEKDATANAIAMLDVFAQMVPLSLDDDLKELEHLFTEYL